jgi:hypothetical protein
MNPNSLIAQVPIGNITGIGPLGNRAVGAEPFIRFNRLISNFIGLMTIGAGLWFIFQLINGGYIWISAGGDKQAVQNAQKKIMNALMGIVIVILSYALAGVVGTFLGFNLLNPGNLLYQIHP